ncbi:MAG: DUF2092 domain-containing protein, partial [Janthinobacterium lividum]
MSRLSFLVLFVLLCLPMTASSGQTLPPVVRHYIATLRSVQTLSVEITQTDHFLPVKKPDIVCSGLLKLEKPNKLGVSAGSAGVASDGMTLTEWDSRNYECQPAPQNLEAMLTPLRRGLMLRYSYNPAANLAFILFTHPDAFSALPNLRDLGPDRVNGIPVRQIAVAQATFWFSSDTGLPVQA